MLHNNVLLFYRERAQPNTAVPTENGREFCGTDSHPYEVYLAPNASSIAARGYVKSDGLVERLRRTALDEFFRSAPPYYETVEALQQGLGAWLLHSNTRQLHHGHRNPGKHPIDTVNACLESVRQESW